MIDWKALREMSRAAVGISDMEQIREALRPSFSAVLGDAAMPLDLRELARAATGVTPEAVQAFEALRRL